MKYLQSRLIKKHLHRIAVGLLTMLISVNLALPPGLAYAQLISSSMLNLPAPGAMLTPSMGFRPALLQGVVVNPADPFQLDFIVDVGDSQLSGKELEEEVSRLVKYFFASLTTPEDEMWVNLSPYEGDRIVPENFGVTEMGRDLLAQDYLLKQLTSSLMYPEDKTGDAFWKNVYRKAREKFGTTQLPFNTFNKVWILPKSAYIFEQENKALLLDSQLKIMLEQDYTALNENRDNTSFGMADREGDEIQALNAMTSEVVREVLIPEIEREVNGGKNFANLRQIYSAMVLAHWYKQRLKNSILSQVYADQNKVTGVDVEDKTDKDKIYAQYIEAFKKGVYNYIKEDVDEVTQEITPRKYYSGGFGTGLDKATGAGGLSASTEIASSPSDVPEAFQAKLNPTDSHIVTASVAVTAIPTSSSSPVSDGDQDAVANRLTISGSALSELLRNKQLFENQWNERLVFQVQVENENGTVSIYLGVDAQGNQVKKSISTGRKEKGVADVSVWKDEGRVYVKAYRQEGQINYENTYELIKGSPVNDLVLIENFESSLGGYLRSVRLYPDVKDSKKELTYLMKTSSDGSIYIHLGKIGTRDFSAHIRTGLRESREVNVVVKYHELLDRILVKTSVDGSEGEEPIERYYKVMPNKVNPLEIRELRWVTNLSFSTSAKMMLNEMRSTTERPFINNEKIAQGIREAFAKAGVSEGAINDHVNRLQVTIAPERLKNKTLLAAMGEIVAEEEELAKVEALKELKKAQGDADAASATSPTLGEEGGENVSASSAVGEVNDSTLISELFIAAEPKASVLRKSILKSLATNLARQGVVTVGDLKNKTAMDLLLLNKVGPQVLAKLIEVVEIEPINEANVIGLASSWKYVDATRKLRNMIDYLSGLSQKTFLPQSAPPRILMIYKVEVLTEILEKLQKARFEQTVLKRKKESIETPEPPTLYYSLIQGEEEVIESFSSFVFQATRDAEDGWSDRYSVRPDRIPGADDLDLNEGWLFRQIDDQAGSILDDATINNFDGSFEDSPDDDRAFSGVEIKDTEQPPGGIDFNPRWLELEIKRDGNGVLLPNDYQPLEQIRMQIQGVVPVIINITPVTNLPLLLGISTEGLPPLENPQTDLSQDIYSRDPQDLVTALN